VFNTVASYWAGDLPSMSVVFIAVSLCNVALELACHVHCHGRKCSYEDPHGAGTGDISIQLVGLERICLGEPHIKNVM
jgi:hypothetical protein